MTLALNKKSSPGAENSGDGTSRVKNAIDRLPSYTTELANFHRAFARELTALVDLLPVCRGGRILDAACGDGFYLTLLARRLDPQLLVGLDPNAACLDLASRANEGSDVHPIALVQGTLETFPSEPEFDLVWCAQSLFTLPDPLAALRQMANVLRPGGMVAILENDTLHQALLPLPSHLELALRNAERQTFAAQTDDPEQYYVGRRLPSLLSTAGLTSIGFQTQSIDRMAPLDRPLERFLDAWLHRLFDRVAPRLSREDSKELRAWLDPEGSTYVLRQPQFAMSWLNILAWGRRPFGPIRSAGALKGTSSGSQSAGFDGVKSAFSEPVSSVDGIHPDVSPGTSPKEPSHESPS